MTDIQFETLCTELVVIQLFLFAILAIQVYRLGRGDGTTK